MKKKNCIFLLLWIAGFLIFQVFFISPSSAQEGGDLFSRSKMGDPQLTSDTVKRIQQAIKTSTEGSLEDTVKILDEIQGEGRLGNKKVVVLKYSDQELQDAVVDLYLNLVAVWHKPRENKDVFGPGDEDSISVLDAVKMCAESTFSPRLYDAEMFGASGGHLRIEYLSRVNPEKTLDVILNSRPKGGKCSGYLHYMEGKKSKSLFLGNDEGVEIVQKILKARPELLQSNKAKVYQFIKDTILLPTKTEGWYSRDFVARSIALDILEMYEDPASIPMIKQLADEAIVKSLPATKKVPPEYDPEKLKAKADEILSGPKYRTTNP